MYKRQVVQRVVDGGGRDVEPGGGGAVDFDVSLQALILQVAGNVGELRLGFQALDEFGYPLAQFRRARILERELVLGRCV